MAFHDPGRQRKDFWIVKRRNSPFYYVRFLLENPDGSVREVTRSTKQTVKYRADRRAREMLRLETSDLAPARPDVSNVLFFKNEALITLEALFTYRQSIKRPYAEVTKRDWRALLKKVVLAFPNSSLKDLTPRFIENRLLDAFQNGVGHRRLVEWTKLLRALFAEWVRSGTVQESPFDKQILIPGVNDPQEKGTLDDSTIKSVFGPKAPWKNLVHRVAALFALSTGCRVAEVSAVQWEDLRETGWVIINKAYDRAGNIRSTKTGKGRWVFLPTEILSEIRAAVPWRTGYIFGSTDAGKSPVRSETIAHAFSEVLTGLELRKDQEGRPISFHSLRATYNTRLVSSGISGEVVRALMGHSSPAMTRLYSHGSEETLAPVAEQLQRMGWKVAK